MDSTETYWEVDGTSIQTFAYNISTWGGDRQTLPPLRGEDVKIPYRPGAQWFERVPDSRIITLEMWVVGADENGEIPGATPMRLQFEHNFRALRNLFWNPNRQILLTKRWKEINSTKVYQATAKATFAGGLTPNMTGGARATFSVDLLLSDPFFYGEPVEIDFPSTGTSNKSVYVEGDWDTTELVLDINGSRTNPRLTNTSELIYVNLNQTIGSGQMARLDVNNWKATLNPLGSPQNIIRTVSHFGYPFWMVLRPGTQNLSLTSVSGTGSAKLTYIPRWL